MSSQVEETLLELLSQLRDNDSLSPNQVAKVLNAENWQRELPKVRNAALGLARNGRIEYVRKGKPISPEGIKGIYRLRLAKPEAKA